MRPKKKKGKDKSSIASSKPYPFEFQRRVVRMYLEEKHPDSLTIKPFIFDIIIFFAEFNMPKSERVFTLICNYFNELTCYLFSSEVSPKVELNLNP